MRRCPINLIVFFSSYSLSPISSPPHQSHRLRINLIDAILRNFTNVRFNFSFLVDLIFNCFLVDLIQFVGFEQGKKRKTSTRKKKKETLMGFVDNRIGF
ncbi:hypothetical protein YC2023_042555 [Brassica napus]